MDKKSELFAQRLSKETLLKCLKAAEETLRESPNNILAKRLKIVAKNALILIN